MLNQTRTQAPGLQAPCRLVDGRPRCSQPRKAATTYHHSTIHHRLPDRHHPLAAGIILSVETEAGAMRRASATTSSTWRFRSDHRRTAETSQDACKSIQRPSNAHCAQSDSRAHTICDHICARTQTSDHSCVQSAAKPSRDSMIANDMRVCTAVRRSSSARASYRAATNGVAEEDSLAQMHWVDISAPKLDEFASSPCSTKKLQSGKRRGWRSNNMHKWQPASLHHNH